VGQKLAGRAALVTGGIRGIGAAICTSLAGQGTTVAAGYSGNTERAEAFAAGFERPRRNRDLGQANYAASKSGLLGLTKALAREVAFVLARSGRLTPFTIVHILAADASSYVTGQVWGSTVGWICRREMRPRRTDYPADGM
jgi:NAD(P)-dependent dehydrogenase (short-subunit alcohol dehydrogenase family)